MLCFDNTANIKHNKCKQIEYREISDTMAIVY